MVSRIARGHGRKDARTNWIRCTRDCNRDMDMEERISIPNVEVILETTIGIRAWKKGYTCQLHKWKRRLQEEFGRGREDTHTNWISGIRY